MIGIPANVGRPQVMRPVGITFCDWKGGGRAGSQAKRVFASGLSEAFLRHWKLLNFSLRQDVGVSSGTVPAVPHVPECGAGWAAEASLWPSVAFRELPFPTEAESSSPGTDWKRREQ